MVYNIETFGSVLHTLLKMKNGDFLYYKHKFKKNIDAEVLIECKSTRHMAKLCLRDEKTSYVNLLIIISKIRNIIFKIRYINVTNDYAYICVCN